MGKLDTEQNVQRISEYRNEKGWKLTGFSCAVEQWRFRELFLQRLRGGKFKELVLCNKKARSSESAMFNATISSFSSTLQSALERSGWLNSDLFAGKICPVRVALFQADSVIAY